MSWAVLSHFSHVRLFVILWTVARQAPLSTGFSRQEYCSGLPCPSLGDLPDSGVEPVLLTSLHWQVDSSPLAPAGKLRIYVSSSVQFSRSVVSDSLRPYELQHARLPCSSPSPGAYSNSCPLSWYAIQPSHSLSSPSPPAFNLSQHQGLFQ